MWTRREMEAIPIPAILRPTFHEKMIRFDEKAEAKEIMIFCRGASLRPGNGNSSNENTGAGQGSSSLFGPAGVFRTELLRTIIIPGVSERPPEAFAGFSRLPGRWTGKTGTEDARSIEADHGYFPDTSAISRASFTRVLCHSRGSWLQAPGFHHRGLRQYGIYPPSSRAF